MIKRTMPYISEELNTEIGDMMDSLSVDEMDEMMHTPVPTNMRMSFWTGYHSKKE